MGFRTWGCKIGLHAYDTEKHEGSDSGALDSARAELHGESRDPEYANLTYAVACRHCGHTTVLYRIDPRYMTTYWH